MVADTFSSPCSGTHFNAFSFNFRTLTSTQLLANPELRDNTWIYRSVVDNKIVDIDEPFGKI